MKYILGTKEYMTTVFTEKGRATAGTIISVPKNVVTDVRSTERDGYSALQLSFGSTRNLSKPVRGHFKDLGTFQTTKEFRVPSEHGKNTGDTIDVSTFATGDIVIVSAISKGKGFQGVVKRHGFSGGQRTHGQKHSEREPGSIGGGARAGGRVTKNKKMPGRMGGDRITVKNLKVLFVDAEKGEMIISGAVPGRTGTVLEIKSL